MKEQKYSKEFEAWYRNVLLPPIQCDGDLFYYFKHHAWKAWNAGRARLKSNDNLHRHEKAGDNVEESP